MKIIFLDFDGVLNSMANHFGGFGCRNMEHLNTLAQKSGAVVVVSSAWRKGRSINALKLLLKNAGFNGRVIDKTPEYKHYVYRGIEIQKWLKDNATKDARFVILDDDSDMGRLRPYLVQTNPAIGLQAEDVERALQILGAAHD